MSLASPAVSLTPEEAHSLRVAPMATLNAKVRSENAKRLTAYLANELTSWEAAASRRKHKRQGRLEKLRAAVGSFVADLLGARNHTEANGWTWRSLSKSGFTGQTVSFRNFDAVVSAWVSCGLVERIAGFKEPVVFDPGDQLRVRGKASRFRATPKLIGICAEYGITPLNASEHFAYRPPEHPLRLNASSRTVALWKEPGKPMRFARTEETARLEEPIKELNAFIAQHVISGAMHRWFHRTFNMGDEQDFAWNKGGRLYSDGKGSYQNIPRPERLKITIDGESVCEIDIRASYLTILHALHHVPFEVSTKVDPYQISGIPRNVVKAWCTVRFGTKGARTRWPADAIEKYTEDNAGADLRKFKIRDVEREFCRKFPLMGRWGDLKETWADLMWLESEAVVSTVILLMHSGVPSLPVHDSLIVPASAEAMASDILSNNYNHVCGVIPALVAHTLE
jgi:hypothetical protein